MFRRLEWCGQDKEFVRHKIWPYIEVSQEKAIEELEIPVERNTKEDFQCTPAMRAMYSSLLGQVIGWQCRTQFQCCYNFSRCAPMADSPTVGDVKALNNLARQIIENTWIA